MGRPCPVAGVDPTKTRTPISTRSRSQAPAIGRAKLSELLAFIRRPPLQNGAGSDCAIPRAGVRLVGYEILTQRLPLPGRPLSSAAYPAERISSSAQRTNLGSSWTRAGSAFAHREKLVHPPGKLRAPEYLKNTST